MELNEILQVALRASASDIHLKAGLPPMFRVDGALVPLKDARRLPPEEVARMAFGIMSDFQKEKFKQTNEVDLAYGVPGLGRFRVNIFQQRGTVGGVFRVIPFKIQTIEQLMLPKSIEKLAGEQRGLILVTGTTGSCKSTTLAAMIDHVNAAETCHIMTIEDPIEFLVRDKRSIVNQREVGVDTMSFGQALKSALRQDPDVILVGEMRDLETIETALTAAETGHLVMSTLHTFDQSLMSLLRSSLITYEEALRQATNPDDFALRVSGISGTSDSKWDGFERPAAVAPAPAPRPAPSPP